MTFAKSVSTRFIFSSCVYMFDILGQERMKRNTGDAWKFLIKKNKRI